MRRLVVFFVFGLFMAHHVAAGPVNLNVGGTYTQNFNGLPVTGTAVWTNDSTLTGWFAERSGTGTLIQADAGASVVGNLHSYGAISTADRALGSLGATTAGAGSFAWGVLFRNTNALMTATITNIAFTGEQWRKSGGTDMQAVALSFSVATNAISALTPGTDADWTLLSAGSFSSLVNTATAAAIDGNAPANRTNLALKTAITVPPGSFVLLRWSDPDHAGNDHGLAVDDLRVDWLTHPPPVLTDPATAVSSTSAVLNGTADPAGSNLFVSFEYGLTTNYGNTVQATPSPASGTNAIAFSALVTNLTPSVLYHFRAVGTNALPTAVGVDRTFFTPGVSGSVVNAIAVLPGNRMLVGGSFTNLAGAAVRNLALVNSNGTVEAGFRPEVAGEVHALAVELDGRFVVGGSFTHVDGTPRNNIARIATNGALDLAFNPDIGGPVFALRSEISRLYWPSNSLFAPNILAGGRFSRVGTNTLVRSFARLDAGGSLLVTPLGTNVIPLAAFISSISPSTTGPAGTIHAFDHSSLTNLFTYELLVAGQFARVGPINSASSEAELNSAVLYTDGAVKIDQSLSAGLAKAVVWQPDGNMLVGGVFTQMQVSGVSTGRNNLGRSGDSAFNPSPDGPVQTIALQADGRIIVGGSFTNLRPHGTGPVFPRLRLARIEADGSIDPGFAPQFDGEIMTVALRQDGRLAVGGRFTNVNGSASHLFAILTNDAPEIAVAAESTTRIVLKRSGSEPEISGAPELSARMGTPSDAFTIGGLVPYYGILLESSTNGGVTWTPAFTELPVGNTGDPGNQSGAALYRGSGGFYANTDLTNGMLVRVRGYSTDGSGSQGLVETIGVITLAPRLLIETLEGAPLTNAAIFDVGRALVGGSTSRTFRLRSVGNLPVTNIELTASGAHVAAFTVPTNATPPPPLAAATGVATVVVQFAPAFGSVHTAAVQVASSDTNQPTFVLTGRGMTAEQDEDGDGLSNGAEGLLAAAGFNLLVPDPTLVAALRSNGLYRATDLQALAGESALIARDPGTGQFKLTFGVQRSTNLLQSFELLPMSLPQLQITPQGRVEFRFSDPAEAAFYYIDAAP